MAHHSDKPDDALTELMAEADAVAAAHKLGGVLRWKDGDRNAEIVVKQRILIGSSPEADVVISDPTVSRVHCVLEALADGVWIHDQGSRNGTFVENLRVTAARLVDPSRIRIGSTDLRFDYGREGLPIPLWPYDNFGPLVGRSRSMRELFALLSQMAQTDGAVLIEGETGTGKELAAQAIHDASPRRDEPFVVVDCGALPENLIEAELFGHAQGAFTGAVKARAGAFESAQGGTVFLDEIGELPLAMQPKLLRALESGTVRRLGENEYRKIDVRFVSATHRNLLEMVNQGDFREDLYFRIGVLPIALPSLRDHAEDVPLLVEHFLGPKAAEGLSAGISAEASGRPWRGNVRELRNFVERAVALGTERAVAISEAQMPGAASDLPQVPLDSPFKVIRQQWLDHLEKTYISGMIAEHGRSLSKIAQASGLDRSYVHRLIRKHEL